MPAAEWKLIETNVRFSHQLPTYEEFIANDWQCTRCGNKTNDRDGLPAVCPWCKAYPMTVQEHEQMKLF